MIAIWFYVLIAVACAIVCLHAMQDEFDLTAFDDWIGWLVCGIIGGVAWPAVAIGTGLYALHQKFFA